MKFVSALALGIAAFALIGTASAADPVTGTWKWTQMFGQNNQAREVSLKLKLDGDKVTGSMPGRNNTETAIEGGTFKDGTVSFSITRERDGNKITTKYSGKIDGDKLKGKIEGKRQNGEDFSRDWEATKAKE
jgi:hypothetical protein